MELNLDEIKKAQRAIVKLHQKVEITPFAMLAPDIRTENPQRAYAVSPLQFRQVGSQCGENFVYGYGMILLRWLCIAHGYFGPSQIYHLIQAKAQSGVR